MQFCPVTSSLFGPSILLSTLFSNTLSLCSSPNMRETNFQTHSQVLFAHFISAGLDLKWKDNFGLKRSQCLDNLLFFLYSDNIQIRKNVRIRKSNR
jgi:hypothetical protein